jgi:predicted ribosome quality control (RQC) complex YloA/Tae2 family protein
VGAAVHFVAQRSLHSFKSGVMMTFPTDLSIHRLKSLQQLMVSDPQVIDHYLQNVVEAGNQEFAKRITVLETGLSEREQHVVEQIQDLSKLVAVDPTVEAEQQRLEKLLKTLDLLSQSNEMAINEITGIKTLLQKQEANIGTLNEELCLLRAKKVLADNQSDPTHEKLREIGDKLSQHISHHFQT